MQQFDYLTIPMRLEPSCGSLSASALKVSQGCHQGAGWNLRRGGSATRQALTRATGRMQCLGDHRTEGLSSLLAVDWGRPSVPSMWASPEGTSQRGRRLPPEQASNGGREGSPRQNPSLP